MRSMFEETPFNQDMIHGCTVGNMGGMFSNSKFNGDISNWDVSNIAVMDTMFTDATNFNQDIGDWDVSSVTV